jgi:transposase
MDKRTKTVFVGIDVSKLTLDICVRREGQAEQFNIVNDVKNIKAFFKGIRKARTEERLLIGLENTGMYNWSCYDALDGLGAQVYVINALHLKRSMGLVRGKNDKVDAQRIALQVELHESTLKPSVMPELSLRKLRTLVSCRKRLVGMRTRMAVPAAEVKALGDKELTRGIGALSKRVCTTIDKEIKGIERQIDDLISQCDGMQEMFNLITSVPGVGKVLAWELLIKTDMFRAINDPRKLACFAGVVPFEHSSGTSVHRRPRVSQNADKALKRLLHMAALRVTHLKGELQLYYIRKVAEGKNKMAVINALRNKIVARICSAVNNNRPYQQDLVLS